MVMKIRCTACGSSKFSFTHFGKHPQGLHGACCAACRKRLCLHDLLPQTPIDPATRALIDRQNSR